MFLNSNLRLNFICVFYFMYRYTLRSVLIAPSCIYVFTKIHMSSDNKLQKRNLRPILLLHFYVMLLLGYPILCARIYNYL